MLNVLVRFPWCWEIFVRKGQNTLTPTKPKILCGDKKRKSFSKQSHILHSKQYINVFYSVAPADEVKYIVCKSKLWDILKYCLKCGKVCLLEVINEMGTYIKTRKTCPSCEESSDWESQSFIKSIPTVNIQLSASILFSGSSPAKVLRILKLMNVAAISRSTYETHQTKYLQPTIMTHWTAQQYGLFDTLRTLEDGLILGGDGRCDSPGHCAKYGAYTMMELRMNKIIDVQLVQVGCYLNTFTCILIYIYIFIYSYHIIKNYCILVYKSEMFIAP